MTTFKDYAAAGFLADLLPICPPNAKVSEDSKLKPEMLGKIPGKLTRKGWVGFGGWTAHVATAEDIGRWSTWACGIGLQGRNFPALDIDVSDEKFAAAVEDLAIDTLGTAPARYGNGERRLLVYAGAGFGKRSLIFTLNGERHLVELLGAGQQYIVEGVHPKTGKPYHWTLAGAPRAADLHAISAAQLDRFYDQLEELIELFGGEVVTRSTAKAADELSRMSDAGLAAPSLDAVNRALSAIPNEADYDEWISTMVAVKAATGGSEDGFELFAEWSASSGRDDPDTTRLKWDSFRPPYHVGWDHLSRLAEHAGDGSFSAAEEDFDPVEPGETAPAPSTEDLDGLFDDGQVDGMFSRYVWVEMQEAALDLTDKSILGRQGFNARNYMVGDPADSKKSAWAVFLRDGHRRRTVRSLTYRPGAEPFVREKVGECANIWLPAEIAAGGDDDITPWLEHLAYIIPCERERDLFVRWMAWVAQNQTVKPNWHPLVGGAHGVGKSTMIEPLRAALGAHNVNEIGPADLASGYTGWLANAKLGIIEEVHSFERKETMQRLKNYTAAPPHYLQVNPKYGKQFEIPNLIAMAMFTNHHDALAIEKGERRFFVVWTEAEKRERSYYARLMNWFEAGGAAAAARYLLGLDLTGFDALGPAPATAATGDMQASTRSLLDEWIEDGMEEASGPFKADVVAVSDVWRAMPPEVAGRAGRPTVKRLGVALRRAGAKTLGERLRLGKAPDGCTAVSGDDDRARLVSLRDHARYASAQPAALAALFWAQRQRAQADEVASDFKETT